MNNYCYVISLIYCILNIFKKKIKMIVISCMRYLENQYVLENDNRRAFFSYFTSPTMTRGNVLLTRKTLVDMDQTREATSPNVKKRFSSNIVHD